MFGLGMGELFVILAVLLIFVGPSALPGLAKSIGKGVREIRKASQDLKSAAMEDEDIGSTVRELQSALRDDPTRPAPGAAGIGGRTIGRPVAAATPIAAPVTPGTPLTPATPAPPATPASSDLAATEDLTSTAADAARSTTTTGEPTPPSEGPKAP